MFRPFDHHQGVFSSFAKITLIKNTFDIPILNLVMCQHVVLCVLSFTWIVPQALSK